MATEMDRFYDLLQRQGEILKAHGELLATIEQSQVDTRERLFGSAGSPGVIQYLHAEVARHSKQITFWKGGIAVLTLLWGAAVAYGSVIIGKQR